MRTFQLVDNNGSTYDITVKDKAFFHNITGLGYERDAEYQRVKDRYTVLADNLTQPEIKGAVRFFKPGAEDEYFRFAQFCQNPPIKMVYNPGHGEYYRWGRIVKVERSDGIDALTANISFRPTTPWIKDVNVNNDNLITDGKTYDYTYDYTYSDTIQGSVIIDSDSFQSSPIKLTIYGEVVNPQWRHYVNNRLVTMGQVNVTIPINHKLVIDTTVIPYSIKEYNMANQLIADRYQYSDFSTGRFIRLENGVNLISAAGDGGASALKVEAQIEYATV